MKHVLKKRGITLIEVALVLGVIAFLMVGLANMMADTAGATRAKTTAQKMQQIADAAQAYVRSNQSAIDAHLSANPTDTITIPVAKQTEVAGQPVGTSGFQSLQAAGFLPQGFIDRTSNGQSHALLIKAAPGGKIDAVLTAFGGSPISDKDLTTLTVAVGAAGGAVYDDMTATPDTHIVGTAAGWTYATNQWIGQIDGTPVEPMAGRPAVSLNMNDAGNPTSDENDYDPFATTDQPVVAFPKKGAGNFNLGQPYYCVNYHAPCGITPISVSFLDDNPGNKTILRIVRSSGDPIEVEDDFFIRPKPGTTLTSHSYTPTAFLINGVTVENLATDPRTSDLLIMNPVIPSSSAIGATANIESGKDARGGISPLGTHPFFANGEVRSAVIFKAPSPHAYRGAIEVQEWTVFDD